MTVESQGSLTQLCIACLGDQITHLMGRRMDVEHLNIVLIGDPNPSLVLACK